jgi:hypothetical protein
MLVLHKIVLDTACYYASGIFVAKARQSGDAPHLPPGYETRQITFHAIHTTRA